MMVQENVHVLSNEAVSPGYYRIGLSCGSGYASSIPGQFVMLRFADHVAPLLRRPFSIHGLIAEGHGAKGIELLYKVVGEGTQKLSRCREGDTIDILGPLGNGFRFAETSRRIFIAAGGIGVAPMLFLAHFLKRENYDLSRAMLFLGGRSEADILCKETFLGLGLSVYTTTDDGSVGDRCLVTDPLETAVKESPPDILYACGPLEMLKCVIGIAERYHVPCQVSIEATMACGIGACLGCAVEKGDASGKYFHACLDGPVFDAHMLAF